LADRLAPVAGPRVEACRRLGVDPVWYEAAVRSHGGRVMAAGTPEQVARSKKSHTGQALAPVLSKPGSRELTLNRN